MKIDADLVFADEGDVFGGAYVHTKNERRHYHLKRAFRGQRADIDAQGIEKARAGGSGVYAACCGEIAGRGSIAKTELRHDSRHQSDVRLHRQVLAVNREVLLGQRSVVLVADRSRRDARCEVDWPNGISGHDEGESFSPV